MIGRYAEKASATVVGLMSGTSLDGIDAAVVRIDGCGLESKIRLLHYYSEPYEPELREKLKLLCTEEHSSAALLCSMNVYLAERFAAAALEAVRRSGTPLSEIDLISSHGQTVWHIPQEDPTDPYLVRSTLQIGDLSFLAKRTGKPAVGDFRPADVAVGGQGAPLAPYGDLILFRDSEKGRALQNIGGIGNCTVLPPDAKPEDVFAFDTGPGNMIIDEAVLALSEGRRSFDEDGRWAAEGEPDGGLLEELMSLPYFRLPPPKSTGRELFGKPFAANFLRRAQEKGLSAADTVATATAFTAASIADGYRRFVLPRADISEIAVSGGGARNGTLLAMLAKRLPEAKVLTSGQLGVDEEAKEAMLFALLGHDFMHGIANNLPAATGAGRKTVMGKLALPD